MLGEVFETIDAVYQAIGKDLFAWKNPRRDLADRDPDEAAFFALHVVDGEITNGGIAQLFTNSTGDVTHEAIAGAERFELPEHAQVLRDAVRVCFPHGMPLDGDARNEEWEGLHEQRPATFDAELDALDERWFARQASLEERLYEYAKRHPAAADIANPS